METKKPASTAAETSAATSVAVKKAAKTPVRQVALPSYPSVRELSELLSVSSIEVIKQLMRRGIMANINQVIDFENAVLIAHDFGCEAVALPVKSAGAGARQASQENQAALQPRPPVVTIMGHVDHGKTKLLDAIRKTNVVATEAGGITQHIGAYQVEIDGRRITFLDTPGHEAFTAMRARGARVTDIAVLVVAADDGVMPQTVEAIDHARAAGVPIVVALNKIDKANANPEKVKQQLAERGVVIEEWGGDVICVPVSAKMGQGIPDLLANILVVAEVAELKANPDQLAYGVIIEAKLDKTRGPLATVLVQDGTLKEGDHVLAGSSWGRVKAMFNDRGKRIKRVEPATPVEILGLNSVPQAGDKFQVAADDRALKEMVQQSQAEKATAKSMSLSELASKISSGEVKELNVVIKTDVQGSIEPIKASLERLKTEKAKVGIIHASTGTITESDVLLALASKGIIVGFNTSVEPGARRQAEAEGVDIRLYNIIYELIDDVEKALMGLMEPTYVEVVEGHAEVRAVFGTGKGRKVAGVYITDGRIYRGAPVRIVRQGQMLHQGQVDSLKRFKEDVREAAAGFEAGVGVDGFNTYEVGDIFEVYRREKKSD
jgi:translation initiation factor IF-2